MFPSSKFKTTHYANLFQEADAVVMTMTDEQLYTFIHTLAHTNPRASAFRARAPIFDYIPNTMDARKIHLYERAVFKACGIRLVALEILDDCLELFDEAACQQIKFYTPSGKETNLPEGVAFHRLLESRGLLRDGKQSDLAREWLWRCKDEGWF